MDIDKVTFELRAFVREQFGIPENDSDFNDEVNLFNYGYIDSFGAVELTGFIERQFAIRLTESDWASFPSARYGRSQCLLQSAKKGKYSHASHQLPIPGVDADRRSQLEYALAFASEKVVSYKINNADSTIEAEVSTEAACESVSRKIENS